MPSYNNARLLEKRLQNCDTQLNQLFNGQELSRKFLHQLNQIKYFYNSAFNKTDNEDDGIEAIEEYENFISLVSQVKSGQINADKAIETIKDTTESKQADVIIANFFKVCELMFWAAAAFFSYLACVSVGIPLTFCEPILGITVSLSTFLMTVSTASKFLDCFDEFESLDKINEHDQNQKDTIRFFSKTSNSTSSVRNKEVEVEESSQRLYPNLQTI
ncbi:DUF5638 domain-containing protein [Legionella pneumophila]|uniref:DUF5638 domain-containing protein n=1 Tax=Legionella pneumophila subsp. pascullei TaxID=91890 RepID=A0AAX2IY44_LEGPN|nr:DUF5638 domain-containing protein [Legionella pneumophila]AMP89167.1 hypothetical protein AXF35_05500 [Legionella pneumophila subsp. pascullei]AMP93166.1 hypothetical protein AXF36_11295 [Legionella pneumophila subsp. pascullei]AMP96132.1 hypothetical protein AXF37_11185 [Legionella pneumophila subsp. pascullei]SQG91079.1 Uncharacterised protein [Legionella pneumophila subsp. pascullei]VEH07624.1 Uncharacterised protein [Legionella pneumophila subsp. pascullei]